MKIGGLQKVSLIDFPDRVAAIVFTQGCHFRCGYCHNPQLAEAVAREQPVLSEDEIFLYLDKRKGLLDGVVLTGGEPTVQNDLEDFILKIRNRGYEVKLDTSGYFPEKLEPILQKRLVDYVAMDLKTLPERYADVVGVPVDAERILTSVELIKNSGIDYEFRTTVVEGIHSREVILELAKIIQGAQRYYLQRFVCRDDLMDECFKERKSVPESVLETWAQDCRSYVNLCAVR